MVVGVKRIVGRGTPLIRTDTPGRKSVPVTVVVKPVLRAINGTGSTPKLVNVGAALPLPEGAVGPDRSWWWWCGRAWPCVVGLGMHRGKVAQNRIVYGHMERCIDELKLRQIIAAVYKKRNGTTQNSSTNWYCCDRRKIAVRHHNSLGRHQKN